jgi:hypothetical protein
MIAGIHASHAHVNASLACISQQGQQVRYYVFAGIFSMGYFTYFPFNFNNYSNLS